MIEIAFLIRSLNYGGAERQLITLVKALNKKKFNITVLYFYSGGALEKDLQDSGIRLISLEKRERWDLFGFCWRLVSHLKHINPDVLHGYLGTSNLLTIFLKPFLPSTRIVWGVRASNVDLSRYDWLPHLTFKVECFLSRFADAIIVNSYAGRAYHLKHRFPADKMVVIANGIDTERFKPDSKARAKVRAEWGISEDKILIGLVGRLDPMKDHPTFLKASALLCKQRQDVSFVCVGSGSESYAQKLYRLTQKLGISEKVIWAGVRTDMPAVHNALDIATSSSSYGEGFSNAIGEAMACGVPCVVTDVGDSALIVGQTGASVPSQNPETLASGWVSCLGKDRDEMGLKARSRILEHFSVKQLVEKTQATLQAITNLSTKHSVS
ncbi:glycosyltransferase [Coleofasciculus sp. FACHB-712]|uniref:glycosyltransferase n=1 Tax=Coleofasciculus sp. FACHB-712 TaxID=2692789 RepID=UPI0016859543|nr:glycosyltransferase [Coleofasciculus sp. FACHB-712]MBD1945817.1 glycosyltransferase [Coleofasciculus sp. FACHB-712]